MDTKQIKIVLIAFVFYLAAIWAGGYANAWLGLSASGDFLHVIGFAFVPFIIFWIIWTKWGQKFTKGT